MRVTYLDFLLGVSVVTGVVDSCMTGDSIAGWLPSKESDSDTVGETLGVPGSEDGVLFRYPVRSFFTMISFSFFAGGGGGVNCWATCWATIWWLMRGFLKTDTRIDRALIHTSLITLTIPGDTDGDQIDIPCGGSFPHITYFTLECFWRILESTNATVPFPIIFTLGLALSSVMTEEHWY